MSEGQEGGFPQNRKDVSYLIAEVIIRKKYLQKNFEEGIFFYQLDFAGFFLCMNLMWGMSVYSKYCNDHGKI